MTDKPIPLREALLEAVGELVSSQIKLAALEALAGHTDLIERAKTENDPINKRNQAYGRVAALIDQIPIVFEAREGKGE